MRAVLLLLTAALSAAAAVTANAAPRTVVTIAPLHSLVAGVMAGAGEPYLLLDAAASPHTHTLRPSQARRVYNAELLVQVGGGLESFLTPMLQSLPAAVTVLTMIDVDGMRVLLRGDGHEMESDGHGHKHDGHDSEHDGHDLESHGHEMESDGHHSEHDGHGHEHDGHDSEDDGHEMEAHDHGHDHGNDPRDPHLWLDPANARVFVGEVRDVLSAMDAANAAVYSANAAAILARLESLEADLRAQMRPLRGLPYIVFHDAYRYFEARFDVRPVAVVTLNPERRPGARSSRQLRETIRRTRPKCLFSEPQFPPAAVATLTHGDGGLRHAVLDPLGAGLAADGAAYFQLMANIGAAMAECMGR